MIIALFYLIFIFKNIYKHLFNWKHKTKQATTMWEKDNLTMTYKIVQGFNK